MATLTVVYWRDIPAQVIARAGRKSAKKMLDARFQEAIDSAAMRGKSGEADDYLADWHKGDPTPVEGDLDAAAETCVAELEAAFPQDVLKKLIASEGRAEA